jgi:predicted amino acid racemase
MIAPRLEINLNRIQHNARTLVQNLNQKGIAVTGVTKAFLGSSGIARAMIGAGIKSLGDSRIENIEALRRARIAAELILIRSPMLSQVDRIVAAADVSFNSELDIIGVLSAAARRADRRHGIILMVELGDLRQGIMPRDLEGSVAKVLRLPNIALKGIGTNLGCRSGVVPDALKMAELSALVDAIEAKFSLSLETVSGGNSSNLAWALNTENVERVNDLRLGEAILLGNDPLNGEPIPGLYTDAIVLVAEVIEAKMKPSMPWGEIALSPFANKPITINRGDILQAILAVGHQDVDPAGLYSMSGIKILAASSDHLIADVGRAELSIGSEVAFNLNYSALLRAMTSPFVAKVIKSVGQQVLGHRGLRESEDLIAN